MFLRELPLREAARLMEGEGCFWGISRCAVLIEGRTEEAASGRSSAARGCSVDGGRRLVLGDLPLRGAARYRDGGGCF